MSFNHLSQAMSFAALLGLLALAASPAHADENVAARLAEANKLHVAGYYDRAAEAYRALRADAEAEAIKGLVQCHLETGRYAEAIVLLGGYADLGERDARWHLLWGEAARAVGEYDTALEHARRAVELDGRLARARLLVCKLLETRGEREQAIAEYAWFERLVLHQLPIRAEDLTAVGQGFYRYSMLTRDANLTTRTRHVLTQIFQVTYERVDSDYWPARVAAGDLLREKYNEQDAAEDYEAALAINPHAADAHVGLGWLALERWDFETVERRADRALATNPNHVGALTLRAECKIVERRYADAEAAADRALMVNPRSIEALAFKASAQLAAGHAEQAARFIARAEAVNPGSAILHTILGDTLGGIRQFAEAERYYRRAIACDPTAPLPRIELGRMYMQWGYEDRARETLDTAWDLDPFNDRTKNTLELLGRLRSFAAIETDRYVIHYDRGADEVVAERFAAVLDEIYTPVCAAYDAELARKPIIEIFPRHSEFGVRIHGKPWIHTIGACTGWVIAMDAPRGGGDLPGPYNFASVLTHEFTHTVTLAVSDNRVPHWLTEGLAVRQEHAPRPYSWTEMLAESVRRDELFTLEAFDWSFMRPERPGDRTRAYAQGEWMCEYLVEAHGDAVLNGLLAGFAEGLAQEEVFRRVVGAAPAAVDAAFARWARKQVKEWGFSLTPPESPTKLRALSLLRRDDAQLAARLGRAELDAGDADAALAAARRSVELDDACTLGWEIVIRALGRKVEELPAATTTRGYADDALVAAERLVALDPDNRYARAALGHILLERENHEAALPHLEVLHAVWPLDPRAARGLARIHRARGNDDAALPYLQEVAAVEAHDVEIAGQIAEILAQHRQFEEARAAYVAALRIDPASEKLNAALADVLMQMGDTRGALAVYHDLCRLAPLEAAHHAARALAFHKIGDLESMRAAAREAVRLDPQSSAAALLVDKNAEGPSGVLAHPAAPPEG